MKRVLWRDDQPTERVCNILLKCFDTTVQTTIANYLTTVDLYNEKQTGIGSPLWTEEGFLYVMPIEFSALEQMADVFDIKFVEEV
jgi:hypothetical protein